MSGQDRNDLQFVEQLLREGKKQEALPLLAGYLQKNPNSAQGWWLLGLTVPDPERQIECMERVLKIDPASVLAQAHLEKLRENIKEKSENATVPASVPPFVETIPVEEPKTIPPQPPKQDSKPVAPQKTTPLVEKPKSSVLQYAVLGMLACIALMVLGFILVMFLRGRAANQPAPSLAYTQISLPPTWTPPPTATRSATITPYPTITPPVLPTLAASPTSFVPRSQIGPQSGYYAPNFSLNNVNNNAPTSLSDYEGQAVIIFFWATWCPYCKAEMPSMQMIHQAYSNKGLTILAVDVAENASLARNYRDEHSLTFTILDDSGRDVASKYEVTAFPTYFFVEPSGVISSINVGGVGFWGLDGKAKAMLGLP